LFQQVVNISLRSRLAAFAHENQQTATSVNVPLNHVKLNTHNTSHAVWLDNEWLPLRWLQTGKPSLCITNDQDQLSLPSLLGR